MKRLFLAVMLVLFCTFCSSCNTKPPINTNATNMSSEILPSVSSDVSKQTSTGHSLYRSIGGNIFAYQLDFAFRIEINTKLLNI